MKAYSQKDSAKNNKNKKQTNKTIDTKENINEITHRKFPLARRLTEGSRGKKGIRTFFFTPELCEYILP